MNFIFCKCIGGEIRVSLLVIEKAFAQLQTSIFRGRERTEFRCLRLEYAEI